MPAEFVCVEIALFFKALMKLLYIAYISLTSCSGTSGMYFCDVRTGQMKFWDILCRQCMYFC